MKSVLFCSIFIIEPKIKEEEEGKSKLCSLRKILNLFEQKKY